MELVEMVNFEKVNYQKVQLQKKKIYFMLLSTFDDFMYTVTF